MMPRPGLSAARQAGLALLSMMFILVLLTTMAVYMVQDDHLMLRRVQNIRNAEQALQLALGSEQWAARVLQRDIEAGETDHLNEDWNRLGSPVTVDDGRLLTTIQDLHSRFNLNNLSQRDEVWYPAFRRLLRLLEIDEGVAEAVVDWIDADSQRTHASGAEDLEYLLLDPPYRAANRAMVDLGELELIQGVDAEAVRRLEPFVTVIPNAGNTRINVNTCPPLLLQILGDEMTAADAESLANSRGEEGFPSIEEFLRRPELAGQSNITAEPMVTLASSYFRARSRVRLAGLELSLNSVVRRDAGRVAVTVIQRQRGYL